ncbi:glycosyltransferase family 2 protein [Gillisia hiemivivida]|uniref:Glycosyltransferase family 2 protein n=1 Tax=Gillisia hiemivivida TaxID=291190 RepID=A0A5C6ZQJ8_9FLAO|nr:glycosyltransferase family 2 protein [Gillisia hiemivivida]TXD92845.1 glycosyltransferase family 2 protein [Gillisia hiemivivida]
MVDKVSVIIPTKNRIEATFRSIDSVIAQSIPPHEIIVIDDGSTDDTFNIISNQYPKVRLIRNEVSRGGAVARNQGSEIAIGEYIAFLDSDDEWLANHLENKLQVLKSNNADGVYGTFYLQKGTNKTEVIFNDQIANNNKNVGNAILSAARYDTRTSTFFFRKELFFKVKFDENLKKHQDWDLAINFDAKYNFILDPTPTVNIYVEQGEARMSQKLQHTSSFYFIKKNSKFIESNNIFMFCLKQIMRSQLVKEPYSIIKDYLSVIETLYKRLNFQNKMIFNLLKYKLINVGSIYLFLNKLRK